MKFGSVPTADAVGALSAHTLRIDDGVVRKGTEISSEIASRLAQAGVESVVAARIESGDVGEDDAALRLAETLAGPAVRVEAPFTGRSNLFATEAGVLVLDVARIDAVNAIHESITVATLPVFKPVVTGEMLGTVKIIPYAVRGDLLTAAVEAAAPPGTIRVAPWRVRRVGVVSTVTAALKPTTITKTLAAFEARLGPTGAAMVSAESVPHRTDALQAELGRLAATDAELIVVFGASAIADRRDVIPAAIEGAGGEVEHFGMPVDPGNLLLVGRIGATPVIGAPGCARSPKENGFDWVLQRMLAGIAVTGRDITRLGVGGLLMEIVSRGQPREGGASTEEEE